MANAQRTLSAAELKHMLDSKDDMLLLDVLPEGTYAEGHIPGSENIPSDAPNFTDEVARLAGHADRHIVVYCGGGTESAISAYGLEAAGFTNVHHFRGGMGEWQQLGYPIETGIHSTSRR